MLSWRCRRFRARFSPGAAPLGYRRHRRRCAECAAYAAALEFAAAARLALPERLAGELRALAARRPVPQLPLPLALRTRLQSLGRAGRPVERQRPPTWIASPRYAVAASLLFAVLSAPLVGSVTARVDAAGVPPTELGSRAMSFVGREVAPPLAALQAAGETGKERLLALRVRTASGCTAVEGRLGASVQVLETRVSQIAGRLLPAHQENVPDERPRRTR